MDTNKHEFQWATSRMAFSYSCSFVVKMQCDLAARSLLLNGIIQRALQIEFFDLLGERGIVCRVDEALIVDKIEKTPSRDHLRDFWIVSQSNDFRMLAQLAGTGKRKEFPRTYRIGKHTTRLAKRFVGLR